MEKKFIVTCPHCKKKQQSNSDARRGCGRCIMSSVNGNIDKFQMNVKKNPEWNPDTVINSAMGVPASMQGQSGEKYCPRCKTSKPTSAFNTGRKRCKPCHKDWRKERVAALSKS